MSIKRQRGLTIIELVMFMVIMGVAAAGIIGVLNIGNKSSADPLRRKQAMLIAEAYMEEVQLAGLSFCAANDPNFGTATELGQCDTKAMVGQRVPAMVRPYASVADYAIALNTEERTFAVKDVELDVDVDRDVNGRALGQDRNEKTMGNSSLFGITTTVTLNLLGNGDGLGPDGFKIQSDATDLRALRITIISRYGSGDNDFIKLDGYRTRYAPTTN